MEYCKNPKPAFPALPGSDYSVYLLLAQLVAFPNAFFQFLFGHFAFVRGQVLWQSSHRLVPRLLCLEFRVGGLSEGGIGCRCGGNCKFYRLSDAVERHARGSSKRVYRAGQPRLIRFELPELSLHPCVFTVGVILSPPRLERDGPDRHQPQN